MKTIEALRKLDRETKADVYLVGGYVRDFLRNKKNDDLDIVIRNVDLGTVSNFLINFGNVKQVQLVGGTKLLLFRTYNDNTYAQITLPRREKVQTPDPKNTLAQDSKFRDFRINAMYLPINYKSKKNVIDKVGGKVDIKNRRIVTVGSPIERLKESPDRILRAISLAARTGYNIDKNLVKTIKMNVKLVSKIQPDQIRKDLNHILLSRKPSKYFKLMRNYGILSIILPELNNCVGVKQDKKYHKFDVFTHQIYSCDNIDADLVLRLSALLHDIGKPRTYAKTTNRITFHKHEVVGASIAKTILTRLKYSTPVIKKVCNLIKLHMYYYIVDTLECSDCSWSIIKDKLTDKTEVNVCPNCGGNNIAAIKGWTDAAVRRFINTTNITKSDLNDLNKFPLFKVRAAERLGNGYKKIAVTERQKAFQQRIKDVFNKSTGLKIADLDISGNDIITTFNMRTSPKIGEVLKYLLTKVLEHPPLNNRLDLLKLSTEFLCRNNHI